MNFAAVAHELGNLMQAHPWETACAVAASFVGVAVIADRVRKNREDKLNREDIAASDRRLPIVRRVDLPKPR